MQQDSASDAKKTVMRTLKDHADQVCYLTHELDLAQQILNVHRVEGTISAETSATLKIYADYAALVETAPNARSKRRCGSLSLTLSPAARRLGPRSDPPVLAGVTVRFIFAFERTFRGWPALLSERRNRS